MIQALIAFGIGIPFTIGGLIAGNIVPIIFGGSICLGGIYFLQED